MGSLLLMPEDGSTKGNCWWLAIQAQNCQAIIIIVINRPFKPISAIKILPLTTHMASTHEEMRRSCGASRKDYCNARSYLNTVDDVLP